MKHKKEEQKEEKKSIKEKVADALDISKELMMDAAKLVLIGEHELMIENYKGILEYDEKLIRVKTIGRTVRISGSALEIRTITDEDIQVVGRITSIELVG